MAGLVGLIELQIQVSEIAMVHRDSGAEANRQQVVSFSALECIISIGEVVGRADVAGQPRLVAVPLALLSILVL